MRTTRWQCIKVISILSCSIMLMSCDENHSDPVESYRAFLKDELLNFQTATPNLQLEKDSYEVDVQTTDSLIYPISGTCVTDITSPWVSPDKDVSLLYTYRLRMKHGLKDGKWELTSGIAEVIDVQILPSTSSGYVANEVAKAMKGKTLKFSNLRELSTPSGKKVK